MKDEQFVKEKQAMDALLIHSRGTYIHRCVEIEMDINMYLAVHFCNTERLQNELISHLLATHRVTLDSKVELFCDLLQIHDKNYFDQKPKIKKALRGIIEVRNEFAHLHVDFSYGTLPPPDMIRLLKWKGDSTKVIEYSREAFNDELKKVYEYSFFIKGIVVEAVTRSEERIKEQNKKAP